MKVRGRVVCPTTPDQIRLWAGVCARYVPASLVGTRKSWTLMGSVGALLGMSTPPLFDPERELGRVIAT
jgi:hypothetical protein